MADAHSNFAYSTVATAPSPASSGTSLVVATGDGAKFPTPPFNATVWPANKQPLTSNAEIVRVTAVSTDTLTITRTQESTSARTIGVGDQISATITKKTLTDVEAAATGARIATVTVGPVGSGADYITDGSADDVQLQQAFDTVNTAGGGKVLARAGQYDITATINIYSNTVFSGEGKKTLFKANTTLDGLTNMFQNQNPGGGDSDIIVENLAIDGNQQNRANKTAGADESGQNLLLKNTTRGIVRNIHSYNGAQGNISISQGSTQCLITGNVVHTSFNHNILLNGGYFTAVGCNRNIVSNNISYDAGNGGTQGVGIEVANYSCENSIVGNLSYQNKEGGIHCYKSSKRNTITGNVCIDNSQAGIAMVVDSTYNVISSNLIKGSVQAGINCVADATYIGATNLVIKNNIIISCGWNGIRGNSAGELSNSVIEGNIIDSCGAGGVGNINFGIWLPSVQHTIVANNYIYNSYSSGINADTPFYLNIIGNHITNSGAGGGTSNHAIVCQTTSAMADVQIRDNDVLITSGTGIIVTYNAVRFNISGNTIRTCTGNSGINLTGLTYSVVANNTVTAAANYGIVLHDASTSPFRACTNNLITGNNVSGNTLGGIVEQNSADHNIYTSNMLSGNTTSNFSTVGANNEIGHNITA